MRYFILCITISFGTVLWMLFLSVAKAALQDKDPDATLAVRLIIFGISLMLAAVCLLMTFKAIQLVPIW